MVSKTYIKRRYLDMRTGMTTISPILQLSNFLMLSYLTISEVIPMWLFAPLFIVGILFSFTLVGNRFRKIQTPTDIHMNYEKSTDAAKTVYMLMKRIQDIAKEFKLKDDPEFDKRMGYVKQIGDSEL